MNEFMVVENFVPLPYQQELYDLCLELPYHFDISIGYDTSNKNEYTFLNNNFTDNPGFGHAFVTDGRITSEFWPVVKPLLHFFTLKTNIFVKEVFRVRTRLTIQTPNHDLSKYNVPHVDLLSGKQYYTLVYYVHDSDGDTVIFDKMYDSATQNYEDYSDKPLSIDSTTSVLFRSQPKQGSALFFNGFYYHAGNSPVNYKHRTIINFDFYI